MLARPLPPYECNDGWKPMIDRLIADLDRMTGDTLVHVHQIKEKFGSLRFYYECMGVKFGDDIQARVTESEIESKRTCIACGGHGLVFAWGHSGYISPLCREHARAEKGAPNAKLRGDGWKVSQNWRLVDHQDVPLSAERIADLDAAAADAVAQEVAHLRGLERNLSERFRSGVAAQESATDVRVHVQLPPTVAYAWLAARHIAELD